MVRPDEVPMKVETIDITPTDEGYYGMAALFAEQVIKDVRKPRVVSDRLLLGNVIRIAGYLGSKGRTDLVKQLYSRYDDDPTAG